MPQIGQGIFEVVDTQDNNIRYAFESPREKESPREAAKSSFKSSFKNPEPEFKPTLQRVGEVQQVTQLSVEPVAKCEVEV